MKKRRKYDPNQLDFVCLKRDKLMPRPSGPTSHVDGFEVYAMASQQVKHVAWTVQTTPEHIYNLILEGAFPNAIDVRSVGAQVACYRIPRADVLEFLKTAKAKAFRG
jgi:hypothetical protein